MSSVFITGHSRGLGRGLGEVCLESGWTVFGLSRRQLDPAKNLDQQGCDLAHLDQIPAALSGLLGTVDELDLAILNAGILGEIRETSDTSLEQIRMVMDINVWANKVILDWLLERDLQPSQILLISSGAAVNGNRGWGAYSLSKATLNMLAKLYAHEFSRSHITALAPGLVDTAMQDYLCDPGEVDAARFPSLEKLRRARSTADMPAPRQAAARIVSVLPALRDRPTGSFVDLRNL